ncbi:hypothetical protein LEMLEM_LOCUS15747 [Lemmus lemmus]
MSVVTAPMTGERKRLLA